MTTTVDCLVETFLFQMKQDQKTKTKEKTNKNKNKTNKTQKANKKHNKNKQKTKNPLKNQKPIKKPKTTNKNKEKQKLNINKQEYLFKPLSGATSPGQSGPRSDGNKGILFIPQSFSITGASPSDCFVSYTEHSQGKSYLSAEMQSVYSTVQAGWAIKYNKMTPPQKKNPDRKSKAKTKQGIYPK